jgi:hypothetical protein
VESTGQTTRGWYTAVTAGTCTISASRSLTAQGVHLLGCGGCPGLEVMLAQATSHVVTASIRAQRRNWRQAEEVLQRGLERFPSAEILHQAITEVINRSRM